VNFESLIFFMKIHETTWMILESRIWTGNRTNFESLIFFHENSWKRMNNSWISHLNWEKKRTLKVWYFFMKIHESAWIILESHIWTRKRTNFESLIFFHENSWKCINNTWISNLNWEKTNFESFFFMKIHESAWIILESHIWTGERVKFETLIFFHENSWKRMNNTWIAHLNREKGELWKFDIFHEKSWKRMTNTWISHLNSEKNQLWKFDIFSWKFMKAYEKYLNLTSEPRKGWTLKVWYFSWKFMKAHE
jgi:hypothetical protein